LLARSRGLAIGFYHPARRLVRIALAQQDKGGTPARVQVAALALLRV